MPQIDDVLEETDPNTPDRSSLLALFGIDNSVRKTLREIKPYISSLFDEAVDKLYTRIDNVAYLRAMFDDDEKRGRASRAQKAHWMTILDGDFGDEYFERAAHIGRVHAKVGLGPRWYMSSYSMIYDQIFHGIMVHEFKKWRHEQQTVRMGPQTYEQLLNTIEAKVLAVHKATFLDMEVSLTAYFEENVKKDKEAFEEIAKSFDQIASGNLKSQLRGDIVRRSPLLCKNFERLREGLSGLAQGIKEMSENVERSSGLVKEQSQQVEGQNKEQASAISNVLGSMNSLDRSMAHISQRERELEKQMQKCLSYVATGNDNMSLIRKTMSDIREAWNSVSELTGVIRNIASQTNFLALNASVEAARAGESGRGFSVVATAIRELSQKTTQTAESITQSSIANDRLITDGVKTIGTTLDSFQRAGNEIEEVSTVSNEISHEILSKKDEFSSITKQCSFLSQIANDTNESVKKGRQEAIKLNHMVQKLHEQTRQFRS